MSNKKEKILCGNCKVPIKSPMNPNDSDLCSCPECGKTDRYDYVMSQAKEYTIAMASNSFSDMLQKQFKDSKSISFKAGPKAKVDFDYITTFSE